MKIKKGDNVVVISGKDKGTKSDVILVDSKNKKIAVKGVSIVSKHQKAKSQKEKSSIVKKESFIDSSNVQVICPSCSKPTRIAMEIKGKEKHRICKKCGAKLGAPKKQEAKKKKTTKSEDNK